MNNKISPFISKREGKKIGCTLSFLTQGEINRER